MEVSQYHKFDFHYLKNKVGVTDVAAALGYTIDRKAGIGRYVEMVKVIDGAKTDTLVIRNPQDKATQVFFRRDGSKGDAISLIRENINHFNVFGKNEWGQVGEILSRLANEPVQTEDAKVLESAAVAKDFNKERYSVERFSGSKGIPPILRDRGFDENTFITFLPFIRKVRDLENSAFNGYNIGFPYTSDGLNLQGFELRGTGGFKSKAQGTNSTSGTWVADFSSGNPSAVRHIYLFESAYDAMAFYQHNRTSLIGISPTALVSIGGQLSDKQIQNIIQRYPNATIYDCFDNDLPGKIYGLRTACLVSGIPAVFQKVPNGVSVQLMNKSPFTLSEADAGIDALKQHIALSDRVAQFKAPIDFKDWNDVIRGIRQTESPRVNKHQREESLYTRRNSSIKV